MSADNLVAGILVLLIAGAFLWEAFTDDGPRVPRRKPAPPEWSSQIIGEDLPPMPVARVEDVPALAWDVVTGEIVDVPDSGAWNDERRQIGSGR